MVEESQQPKYHGVEAENVCLGRLPGMLLEREWELELLADLYAEVESEGGKVVLVRGEAGIGKSALVGEFIGEIADSGHVLLGTSDDLLTPQILGPFWDIARAESSLTPFIRDGDLMGLMEALIDLLGSGLRPTVLVLDDIQWADEATLDVVKYLGRRIARTKGLLLLAYRDSEVDFDHPLRRVIGELPPENIRRMHLDRLSGVAVAKLVDGSEFDTDSVRALSEGNPLFVKELLAAGIGKIPSSIQDSVMARASKLSPDARDLLELTAVFPGGAEQDVIETILAPEPHVVSECTTQGLLEIGHGGISFHHEISRRAVEAALEPQRRRQLNQSALNGMGADGNVARRLHHALEASETSAIIELAPAAAEIAMSVGGYREAVSHFRSLGPYLELVDARNRADLLDSWARCELYVDSETAVETLEMAISARRSNGDPVELARTLTFAVQAYEVHAMPDEARASLEESILLLEKHGSSKRLASALSAGAWLSAMRGDWASTESLADRAFKAAADTENELAAILALNMKGYSRYFLGHRDGLEFLEQARARAEAGRYPFEEVRALVNMGGAALERRELALSEDMSRRAWETASRHEIRVLEVHGMAATSEILLWKGEWAEAEDIANSALGSADFGDAYTWRILGTLLSRQGRTGAIEALERNWARAEHSQQVQLLCPSATALLEYDWLYTGTDNHLLGKSVDVLEEAISKNFVWQAGSLARWLWELGTIHEAPEEIAEPYRLTINGESSLAADFWRRKQMPYEEALALMHGDNTERVRAVRIFEELGADPAARKVRRSLRNDGVGLPRGQARQTRDHPVGLTTRQAEVLQLLTEGLSNAEIADQLFISPRTVENHVSAVLNKLQASTREEAVSRAREENLATSL